MRNPRAFWTMVVVSLVAITLLQGLAGTPTSPVERWLHIAKVPIWWPYLLAALTGIGGGIFLNRQMGPQPGAEENRGGGARGGAPRRGGGQKRDVDATRGRYAVPRHVRRERERERRRAERRADAEWKAREEAEAAAKATASEAALAEAPPPSGWLGRLGGVFSRRGR